VLLVISIKRNLVGRGGCEKGGMHASSPVGANLLERGQARVGKERHSQLVRSFIAD
jgi:hypothetical protein